MGTRAAALKRWRRSGERQRMSRLMKSRYRPKVKVGATPLSELPSEMTVLLEMLTDDAIEVVDCAPLRVKSNGECWSLTLTDGNAFAMRQRYGDYVRESGLELYEITPRPLTTGGGVSIVLFVGLPKGDR